MRHHGAYLRDSAYDPAAIEARARARWAAEGLDDTPPPPAPGEPARPKKYVLCFFPYPSGAGLTVGHLKNYVAGDVMARYWRMRGHDVLHPMGWDAFGLPAENEARQTGRHPATTTAEYAATYRRQMRSVSISYDWRREVFSTDPDYYRWTQWFFLLLQRRGLVYRAQRPQWWCPTCATVLANEQVRVTGAGATCWRDHPGVAQRPVTQWFARITAYAERLLADLEGLDWPPGIVAQQRHWIGREVDETTGRVGYRLGDWSISRQRFWGAPVPMVHCRACGTLPLPEDQLPLRLPEVERIPLPGTGPGGEPLSPLAMLPGFADTTCPACGGPARRDTDTLDGFACSSWYFLRFAGSGLADAPFDRAAVDRWLPVDLYIGGAEHAVMHLLYARFWTKVLYDAGLLGFTEPFARLRNQGMVLDATGLKMSKSRPQHVITPDEAVAAHGADAVRAYVLFLAPFDQDAPWQTRGIAGIRRWLRRVWDAARRPAGEAGPARPPAPEPAAEAALRRAADEAIVEVTAAIEGLRFNSAIARLMRLTRALAEAPAASVGGPAWCAARDTLLRLLAPFAPHLAEALWAEAGHGGSVLRADWPEARAEGGAGAEVEALVLQVDGLVRGHLRLPAGAGEAEARAAALGHPAVAGRLAGAPPARVVLVPGRLVNVVTRRRARAADG